MASSVISDGESLYEDISDTELAGINTGHDDGHDDAQDAPAPASYADTAGRGVSPDREVSHNDENDDENDSDGAASRARTDPFRHLSDIERGNFGRTNTQGL